VSEIRLQRLEVWSDYEAANGVRVAFWAPDPVRALEDERLNGDHTLAVALDRTAPAWAETVRERVLRLVTTDEQILEFRIKELGQAQTGDGQKGAEVTAYAPIHDLAAGIVERRESDGSVRHDFELPGLALAQHLAVVFDGAPSHIELGTVEISDRLDFTYRGYSRLQAIHQMLQQLEKGEIEVERDGPTRFLVHILAARGSTAPKGYFIDNRNLHGLEHTERGLEAADRVYAFGADVEGRRHTMAGALWEVTAVAGSDITLAGNPIALDDQLNGFYVEIEGTTTRTQITDSVRDTDVITVASPAGISVGTRLRVCRDASGTDLTYVERPGAGTNPPHVVLDRPDLPATENELANAFLSEWSGGLPVGWSAIGGASLTEDNTAAFHRHGDASAQVVALAEEGGIESDWVDVNPTERDPFFLAQVAVLPVEGVWRVELVAEDAGANETIIPDFARAFTSVNGTWVERLGIQDQATNLFELGIVRAKIRFVADQLDSVSGQASCYFDAGLLMRTSLPEAVFHEGRASNDQWRAANELLLDLATVPQDLDVSIHDVHRLDSATFSRDEIVMGGGVEVYNPGLDLEVDTRITRRIRDWLQGSVTEVELSTKIGEITDLKLAIAERRAAPALPNGAAGEVDGDPLLDEDDPVLFLLPRHFGGAKGGKYVVSTSPVTENDALSGTVFNGNDPISVRTFDPDTDNGLKIYAAVAYYPGEDATGKVGGIHVLKPYQYLAGNDPPEITHALYNAPSPDQVRIGITVTDDGDDVAAFYRTYADGSPAPAYTRQPTSGYESDPWEFTTDVTRPLEDADPDQIYEVYGVDAEGNRSKVKRFRVRQDSVLVDPLVIAVADAQLRIHEGHPSISGGVWEFFTTVTPGPLVTQVTMTLYADDVLDSTQTKPVSGPTQLFLDGPSVPGFGILPYQLLAGVEYRCEFKGLSASGEEGPSKSVGIPDLTRAGLGTEVDDGSTQNVAPILGVERGVVNRVDGNNRNNLGVDASHLVVRSASDPTASWTAADNGRLWFQPD